MGKEREINLSFRATDKSFEVVKRASREVGGEFDRIGIYDELGDLPPFIHLYETASNLPENARTQIGPVGLAPSKQRSMIDAVGYISLLHKIRPDKVFLGLVPGDRLQSIGQGPARVDELREAVETSIYLTRKEKGGYQGRFYQVAPGFSLRYDTPDSLPIFLGVWGDRMTSLAGEIADIVGVGSCANPEMVPLVKSKLRPGAEKSGRRVEDIKVVIGAVTVVDEDRERALEVAKRHATSLIANIAENDPSVGAKHKDEIGVLKAAVKEGNYRKARRFISEELLENFVFAGTPRDIIEKAERVFAAGASGIEFGTPHATGDQIRGIRLLVEEVIPHFRSK